MASNTADLPRTISTDRLKLTFIEKADIDSQELEWLHEVGSNEKAQWWRINGAFKSLQETHHAFEDRLPQPTNDGTYRFIYAVHIVLNTTTTTTRFIGLVALRSTNAGTFTLPPTLFPPQTTPPYLTLELSYQFLPQYWSRGFATESLIAVLNACREPRLWDSERVFVRAMVVSENKASLGVVGKAGLRELGVFVREGEGLWLGGKWSTREELRIWGGWVVEGNV